MPGHSIGFGDLDLDGQRGQFEMLQKMSNGGGMTSPGNGNSRGGLSSSSSMLGGSIDEDQRALALALELSMWGMTDSSAALELAASVADHHHHHHQQQNQHSHQQLSQQQLQQQHQDNLQIQQQQHLHQQQLHCNGMSGVMGGVTDIYSSVSDALPKKSQNMTECVPVPSSEHVAEIVGRQGCKIKALRAKTNTYIKTPVRGDEPVFVVTGRKEDVAAAKREILSAADHFSQIRASRKGGSGNGPSAPAPVPGQVTIQVRVPYRVVGLVVGPKGATIKRIQQQTHTYIVTPSRDKDPVFEVTGLPDNVQVAKREIEAHIAIRTGSFPTDNMNTLGALTGENEMTNPADILASLYKNGMGGMGVLAFEGLGLELGPTINSLSSSLSSVSGLGLALAQNAGQGAGNASGSVGSSTSGGGSLSSLSSLNGFSANPMVKVGQNNNNGGNNQQQHYQQQHHLQQGTNMSLVSNDGFYHGHPALVDLGFSLMDNNTGGGGQGQTLGNCTVGAFMSSSRSSDDSYMGTGSGPNSIEEESQSKFPEILQTTGNNNNSNNSVNSSVWGSFDRDEGLGDSPTLETTGVSLIQ